MSKTRKKKRKKTNILLGFVCILLAVLLGFILVTNYKTEQEESKHLSEIAGAQQNGIEDYEEVKNVKSTKKPESKIKEYAMFIPTVLKQYYAYEKYKNTEFKQNKLLQEQLQKQDVTEEQLRDAKNLQRKLNSTTILVLSVNVITL